MAEETLELITIEPTINLVEAQPITVELDSLQSEVSTPGSTVLLTRLGYAYDRLFTAVITENQTIRPNVRTLLSFSADRVWI